MYNILEARIEYTNGALSRITVLVEMSKGDVRAIYITNKKKLGYCHIDNSFGKSDSFDNQLQQVAAYGMETVDRDEIFPNWRKKLETSNQQPA